MKRRIISSVLALVMVLSLMIVPSITVSAAEPSITANVIDGTFEFDAEKLGLLIDGETAADATAFGDARYVPFKNTSFDHVAVMNKEAERVNATIEFVYDLGEVKPVKSANFNVFVETNNMISKPESVYIYGSADGDCWYNLNAESAAKMPAGAESTEWAITTDATRAYFNIKYVKAVVTLNDGWLFASEFGVDVVAEPAEGSTTNPAGPYEYITEGTAGIRVYTPADQPEGGFDLHDKATVNAQVLKLKATDIEGVYDITFNKCNPWNPDPNLNGHTGIMTLADDELMIAINTGGVIITKQGEVDIESAAKWATRGMTKDTEDDGIGSGDYVYLTDDAIFFFPAAHPIPAYEVAPGRVGELISGGCTYERSQLFRQSPQTWGWDESVDITYPDEDGVTFTDGVKIPESDSFADPVFAGFNGNGTPDYTENGYSWITLDLGAKQDIALLSITFGTSKLGSGIGANNLTVDFLVSDDGQTWTYLGQEKAVDSKEVITTDVTKATNISAQYVQFRFSRPGWMFVSEVEVYELANDPVNLYVNAINDVINYSPYGKFKNDPWHCGEGTAVIISDPALLQETYMWRWIVTFAPTDVAGVYEITNLVSTGGTATAPGEIPEGGFIYIIDTGNDWPSLVANNPGVYDAYADYPNCQTPEVLASYSAIAGLEVGMKASLVNVNLSSSEIRDNFKSLIVVNDTTGGVLDFADIDLTNKELVEVEVDDYTYIDEPYGSWVEAEKGALIDGAIPGPGEAAAPGFQQKTEYAIDFAFKAPADIYAVEMYITQLIGWGIPAADAAHFYGTVDGENYFYLGTGYMPADAANEEGVIADATYAYRVDLDKCATGLTGIRVVLDQDNSISWVFASEFNAYTAQDVVVEEPETSETPDEPVEDESDVVVPPTGEMTPFVILGLALIVVCGAVTVIKKRRA